MHALQEAWDIITPSKHEEQMHWHAIVLNPTSAYAMATDAEMPSYIRVSCRPAGTPPIQVGRPMDLHCRPRFDENGNKVSWSGDGIPNELLYGPTGWCESDEPAIRRVLIRLQVLG